LLIQHSKYSAILSTLTDCLFGDFAHWEMVYRTHQHNLQVQTSKTLNEES